MSKKDDKIQALEEENRQLRQQQSDAQLLCDHPNPRPVRGSGADTGGRSLTMRCGICGYEYQESQE